MNLSASRYSFDSSVRRDLQLHNETAFSCRQNKRVIGRVIVNRFGYDLRDLIILTFANYAPCFKQRPQFGKIFLPIDTALYHNIF